MKRIFIFISAVLITLNLFGQGCATPTSEEGVNVFGFLQPQYDYQFTDDPSNGFRFNRMRIGVMGNIPYDVSYYALLETSPFINSGESIYLIDAFVTYSRFQNFRISMGSFKKPFGAELSMPCSGLYTIERSKFVNELLGSNRDIGAMILGGSDSTLVSYRLAFMNGTGLGIKDNNTFKDIYGVVEIKPLPFLKVGLNALYGRDPASSGDGQEDQRFRGGVDIQANFNRINLLTEFIYAEDIGSYTSGGGCDGGPVIVHQGSIVRNGFYVMGAYNLTSKLQPVIKYEQYDNDPDTPGSNYQTMTYGVNYFLNDWTRLQVNYLYKAEDPTEQKDDALMVQIQVKF